MRLDWFYAQPSTLASVGEDDAGLKKELERGLRAMAATHGLEIGLTLDNITGHFGNFGEPGLVSETEPGSWNLVSTNSRNALSKRRN